MVLTKCLLLGQAQMIWFEASGDSDLGDAEDVSGFPAAAALLLEIARANGDRFAAVLARASVSIPHHPAPSAAEARRRAAQMARAGVAALAVIVPLV